jgi:hypothetical protein
MTMESAVLLERLEDAERRLEEACDEIIEIGRERDRALKAVDELNVQCKFWRQAAEHAVEGWNKLEDKHELVIEAVGTVLEDEATSLSLTSWHALEVLLEELPEVELQPRTPQAPPRAGLRIVETETPRPPPRR